MKRSLVISPFVLVCLTSWLPAAAKPGSELLGTWVLLTTEFDGKQKPVPKELHGEYFVTITPDHYSDFLHDHELERMTWKAEPGAKPRTLDLITKTGTRKAIYAIEGNSLRVCFAEPGKDRPTSFSSAKPGCGLLSYERKKPADPRVTKARQEELKKWQGTWKVASAHYHGKQVPYPITFSFDGQEISTLTDGQQAFGTLFLDPSGQTKKCTIELGYFHTPGIYAFEGDQLKICLGGGPWLLPTARPSAFKGEGGACLLVLKKTAPEEAKVCKARQDGLKELQGSWEAVPQPGEKSKMELIFQGRNLTVRNDGVDEGASYMIDPTSNPKRLSLQVGDFFAPGIYEVRGDTLRICPGEKAWPKPGKSTKLMEYRRKKP